jgi:hypothetical protein
MLAVVQVAVVIVAAIVVLVVAVGIPSLVISRLRTVVWTKGVGTLVLLATERKREAERIQARESARRERIRTARDQVIRGLNLGAMVNMGTAEPDPAVELEALHAIATLRAEVPAIGGNLTAAMTQLTANQGYDAQTMSGVYVQPILDATNRVLEG